MVKVEMNSIIKPEIDKMRKSHCKKNIKIVLSIQWDLEITMLISYK